MKHIKWLALVFGLVTFTACDSSTENSMEDAADAVEDTAKDAADAVEDTAEDAVDAVEDATN